MDNFENNTISSKEGQSNTDDFLNQEWISLTTPITSAPFSSEEDQSEQINEQINKNKKRFSVKSPILTLQLFVGLSFLLFLFVAKTFLPDVFAVIKSFYDKELSATMISSGDFSEFDYSSFFASTDDES